MNGELFIVIVCSIISIYTFGRVFLCIAEYVIMTRKGYWYDCGFQGRGQYLPRWSHETKPSIPARFMIN